MLEKCRLCGVVFSVVLLFNLFIFSTIKTATLLRQMLDDSQRFESYLKGDQFCISFCQDYTFDLHGQCCSDALGSKCIVKIDCYNQILNNLRSRIDQQYRTFCVFASITVMVTIAIVFILKYLRYKRKQRRLLMERIILQNLLGEESRAQFNISKSILTDSFVVQGNDEECPICLDGYSQKKAVNLKCGHMFHRECIQNWMGSKSSCPICRGIHQ